MYRTLGPFYEGGMGGGLKMFGIFIIAYSLSPRKTHIARKLCMVMTAAHRSNTASMTALAQRSARANAFERGQTRTFGHPPRTPVIRIVYYVPGGIFSIEIIVVVGRALACGTRTRPMRTWRRAARV